MSRILAIALGVALIAVMGLSILLKWQGTTIDRLRADNASLTRSVEILNISRQQARTAAEVARAEAQRQSVKAKEYEQVKDAFRKGDFDAPLPDDFSRLLDRVLRNHTDD